MLPRRLAVGIAFGIGVGAASGLAGCSGASDATGQVASRWGALSDAELLPTSPQYLMNVPRGATYRVCLASYMATALPGVETEIVAAVNAWAAVLGRSISVTVETRDLPRAGADQSVDDLAAAYEAQCGDGFDVVVGFGKLDGAIVGLTGASYSYFPQPDGSRKITSFARFLFVRDYDVSPDADPEGEPARWVSLSDRTGRAWSSDDIERTMSTRATTMYATGNRALVLPVLTHEFGHVWGLCDQYEGSTNCDPVNSTSHLVEDSIMGAHGGTERLYLTDDDIAGVRALAARPGFAHDWGTAPSDPAPAIAHAPVDLARIERVARDGATLDVKYGVATAGAAHYAFSLRAAGDTDWTPLTSGFASATAIDDPTARLAITLSAGDTSAYRVRLTVTPDGAPDQAVTTEHDQDAP